jgi:hypothetical protein
MSMEGFEISPGHINLVSLKASKIEADDALKSMNVADRKCKFPTEVDGLEIHQTYSYSNCILECSLLYARQQVTCLHLELSRFIRVHFFLTLALDRHFIPG